MTRFDAAIVSAIYGGYDTPKPALPQDVLFTEWVMVTDDPAVADHAARLGWRAVLQPRPGLHSNRAAKFPKLLPWDYTSAPRSVWIDGAYQVTSPTLAADTLTAADPIAQFLHPWRQDIYEEAAASTHPKYTDEPTAEQVAHYQTLGHPPHWGLWATGVIARHHTSTVRRLGVRWLEEIMRWSFQDQLSQPIVLREVGLRPVSLAGDHVHNRWLSYQGSVFH